MIKPIIIWPNSRLKVKSSEIAPEEFGTDELNQLVTDLFDTLFDSGGVGLSAIQIGVPKRVFVMDIGKRSVVFANPTIIGHKGPLMKMNEGCLSLPGIIEQVERWPTIVCGAFNDKGEPHEAEYNGLEGQCVQHEYDHLDGVVFPDKLSPTVRSRIIKKMQKEERP